MKRSEINRILERAEEFFAYHRFALPPFANWSTTQWTTTAPRAKEILSCGLGWDVTDFGRGDFERFGLVLFTLRNGIAGSSIYNKPYAEKIMIVRKDQVTLTHCHRRKLEDIIVRSGGDLIFELYNMRPNMDLDDTPVVVLRDGQEERLPAGSRVRLKPGESLTLPPGLFHSFWGEKEDVLVGEVSTVNDDQTDNIFFGEQLRFPPINEDEDAKRWLVSDYRNVFKKLSEG